MTDDGGELRYFPVSPEIVRRLDEADGPDAPVRREHGWRDCIHKRCTLDMTARVLRCIACEKVIDPVDWIETLAHEWDMYVHRWVDAKHKLRVAEEAVADLQRQEKNAKARLRNAEHPALKEARLALKEADKVMYDAMRKLDFDPKLKERMSGAWLRVRDAADALRPTKAAAS